MFLVAAKTILVEALREVFDNDFGADPDNRPQPRRIDIEYAENEEDWPFILLQLHVQEVRWTGLNPDEEWIETNPSDPLKAGRIERRGYFSGYCDFTILALTSESRDRIWDIMVNLFLHGRKLQVFKDFFDHLEEGDLIGLTMQEGQVDPQGDTVSVGTPWDEGELTYEATIRVGLIGEFYADKFIEETGLLESVDIRSDFVGDYIDTNVANTLDGVAATSITLTEPDGVDDGDYLVVGLAGEFGPTFAPVDDYWTDHGSLDGVQMYSCVKPDGSASTHDFTFASTTGVVAFCYARESAPIEGFSSSELSVVPDGRLSPLSVILPQVDVEPFVSPHVYIHTAFFFNDVDSSQVVWDMDSRTPTRAVSGLQNGATHIVLAVADEVLGYEETTIPEVRHGLTTETSQIPWWNGPNPRGSVARWSLVPSGEDGWREL